MSSNIEQNGMYLGAESLAGYCVSTARPQAIQNLKDESNLLPANQADHEVSAATHPIMFSGRIAGCVLISSTQPNYFLSPSRLALISKYANLIAVAFDPAAFCKPEEIALLPIPHHNVQASHFATFLHQLTTPPLNLHLTNLKPPQFIRAHTQT